MWDGLKDCPDASDELCNDSCAPGNLTKKNILKERMSKVTQGRKLAKI